MKDVRIEPPLVLHDRRALHIVAKSIYRELREGGFADGDVMSLAGELLELVAIGVRERRDGTDDSTSAA